jgi:hypothetical protein
MEAIACSGSTLTLYKLVLSFLLRRGEGSRVPAFTFNLSAKGKPGDSRAGKRKNNNGDYDY